ncbi:MAG TPA: cysteine--tRNA ligase [Streptosporangiaceae bacterium]
MLSLYDTRTRQAETIEPARRGRLSVYTCGPTVYRPAHVGNLRSYLLADLIRRNAGRHRLLVTSCQNITDVGHLADDSEIDPGGEDKVLAQARAEGKSALEIARVYEEAFHADCAALNIHPADSFPRASESIGMMIELIARLIESGHAYPVPGGSVYFDARSFPGYGELSGNRLADLRPGHRSGARAGQPPGGQLSADPDKRFHADWALWKAAPAARELTYASPWGTGFPGWHTECSAMSLHYLGETIDVHTGGIDLRFPHHEDERAQSNSVTGHEVVRHWVHGEHLLFEGRKMAKSTGNVVLLADLTARGLDPLALRLAFLDHRYRQQLNLTWAVLESADRTVRRWRERVAEWARSPSQAMCAQYVSEFNAAFDDDLDTPAALRVLRSLEKDSEIPPGSKFEMFAHADQLLGLDLARDIGREPAPRPLPDRAAELLEARAAARTAADWATADRLRDQLGTLGVTVTDTPDGQAWSIRTR